MLRRAAAAKLSGALLIGILALVAVPGESRSTQRQALSATSTVCLNEFLPKPYDGSPEEFIELYNPLTVTVAIGGWILEVVADPFPPATYAIPADTIISATGHLVFLESVTGLGLPDGSGCVRLLEHDEGLPVDEQSYDGSHDFAFGRCPDGENWLYYLPPSPGEANICATVTPTPLPSSTPEPTLPPPSSTPTPSPTNTPTATHTATRSPSSTPTETATSTFTPTATASVTPSPTLSVVGRVCLSEFMPAPYYVDWDGDGVADYKDEWIEIYNDSDKDLDLGGCMLDDRAGGGSAPFVFSAGTWLFAGAYGVYYQRDTNIELNNEGDSVRLLAPDDTVVDMVDYEKAAYDVSYSRSEGCQGEWVSGWPPSPGDPNASPTPSLTPTATSTATPGSAPMPSATSTSIHTATPSLTPSPTTSVVGRACISEFVPAPYYVDWDGDGVADYKDEWIELHNDSAQDLDLGRCVLDDVAGAGSYPFVISEGTTLLAGEYRVFYRRDTSIILNNDGDSVRLLAPDGVIVDEADYEQADYDVSYSRKDGCSGGWTTDWLPSPGEPNGTPTPSAPPSTPGMQLYLPLIKRA